MRRVAPSCGSAMTATTGPSPGPSPPQRPTGSTASTISPSPGSSMTARSGSSSTASPTPQPTSGTSTTLRSSSPSRAGTLAYNWRTMAKPDPAQSPTARGLDRRALDYSASIDYDRRLYRHDIAASIAHARMLGRQGIIPAADAEAIVRGLEEITDEIERGEFT